VIDPKENRKVATIQRAQTEEVVGQHVQALLARDLDALTSGYSDDAVIIINTSPVAIVGLAAIRQFGAQILEAYTPEVLSAFKVGQQVIEGEIAYAVWSMGAAIPVATDTFVVRDGKIVAQTAYLQVGSGG